MKILQENEKIYSKMLEVQADLTFIPEMKFYQHPSWIKARNVLDIGCGNGYYLHKLQKRFPDKFYTGIDLIPKLVDIAKSRYPSIKWLTGRCEEVLNGEKFDAIILRLILNQIQNRPQFIQNLKKLISPNTWIIAIDADDTYFRIYPEMTSFINCLQNARSQVSKENAKRNLKEIFHQEMLQEGFSRASSASYYVNSLEHQCKRNMFLYMLATSQLLPEDGKENDRLNELNNWLDDDTAVAQFGLFVETYNYGGM